MSVVGINVQLWTLGGEGENIGDKRDTLRDMQMEKRGNDL